MCPRGILLCLLNCVLNAPSMRRRVCGGVAAERAAGSSGQQRAANSGNRERVSATLFLTCIPAFCEAPPDLNSFTSKSCTNFSLGSSSLFPPHRSSYSPITLHYSTMRLAESSTHCTVCLHTPSLDPPSTLPRLSLDSPSRPPPPPPYSPRFPRSSPTNPFSSSSPPLPTSKCSP